MSNSPLLTATQPLAAQVGGHAGVQMTEDGSLLLKPALPHEIAFYQQIASAGDHDALSKLRHWIPSSLSLVLENLSYGFVKPCILDVKLGTILYDDDASPEKKVRMIKVAHDTTSGETGVRLTGFQVYSNGSPEPILTPKSYGKSIKKEQLLDGIEMFFPVSSAPYLTAPNPLESSGSEVSKPHPGLPPILLHRVLTTLEADLEELKTTISNIEMRMVGGSILIVYEGDWERASNAISAPSGTARTEEDEDEEVEVEIDENGQIVLESIPDETTEEEEEEERQAPLCSLSLIDFAHTRLTDGAGADEGVLKGIQTMIDLVRQRKDKIAAMLPSDG